MCFLTAVMQISALRSVFTDQIAWAGSLLGFDPCPQAGSMSHNAGALSATEGAVPTGQSSAS